MHPLQKQFHDYIEEQELLLNDEKVLLAVSGGVDSMVLAELFHRSGWSFAVAHCNYKLRGNESDEDELHVVDWAKGRNVTIHTQQFDLGQGSVQLNARNARYDWFRTLCKENGYSRIATGHQLEDSLETVILNLARGTGIRGIAGIQPASGEIIRPLLFASRDQLTSFAEEQGIKWREDGSNANTHYRRNFVRHEVIPKLHELNPSLSRTFLSTSQRLQQVQAFLDAEMQKVKSGHLSEENGVLKLDLSWLTTENQTILNLILDEYGFNYATISDLKGSLEKTGRSFYSENWNLTIDRDAVYLKARTELQSGSITVEGEGIYALESRKLTVARYKRNEVTISGEQDTAVLDADKISFPLQLRGWREGDIFQPLGMRGRKKVSDYLIDEKVPLALKDDIKVLTSGEEIVWLMGHRIAEGYKVEEGTTEVLEINIKT